MVLFIRKIVIDLLIVEGPNAKLKKASIIEAGKMGLKREEIPNVEYNKVSSYYVFYTPYTISFYKDC